MWRVVLQRQILTVERKYFAVETFGKLLEIGVAGDESEDKVEYVAVLGDVWHLIVANKLINFI